MATKNIECKLCSERTEDVLSLFLDDVIELVEELTDLKFSKDVKAQSNCCCCTKCVSDLQKACGLKAKLMKWYKNSLLDLEVNVTESISPEANFESDINVNMEDDEESNTETVENSESSEDVVDIKTQNGHLIIKHRKTTQKVLMCDQCAISFEDAKSFNAHMAKHRSKTCPLCGVSIRSDNFKKHVDMHNASPEVCEICGAVAKNKESLRGHMFHQHKNRADSYKCQFCDRMFRYKYKHTLHIQKVHIGERNHQCELCGKRFFTVADLRKHINITHLGQRPYTCTYCMKAFSSRYALKTHVRQHTHETPFRCEFCAEGFRQKVSLNTHLKSKHNVTIVKKTAQGTADDSAESEDVIANENVQEEC